jgi:hypothetical protein
MLALGFAIYLDFGTEFIAGVLGIYLGFAIEGKRKQWERKKSGKELLQQIHGELQQMIQKLTGAYYPERLQVPIWDSTVASGQLNLFNMEQLRSLTGVYGFVKEVDWDSQRIRDLHTECDKLKPAGTVHHIRSGTSPSYGSLKVLLDKYADNHKIQESQLREQINKLLKEDWWEVKEQKRREEEEWEYVEGQRKKRSSLTSAS